MAWVLVPCLVRLRSDINAAAPNRSKASDGSVGDAEHADSVSDHNPDETGSVPIHDADSTNEVHAIDVDKDLNVPGWSMTALVGSILTECRAGREDRLRYIIYNRTIWSASSGWVAKTYDGPNPHTEHAHFSASYSSSREADTGPWVLRNPGGTVPDLTTENYSAALAAALDDPAVQARFRRETVSYPLGTNPAYNVNSLFQMLRTSVPGLTEAVNTLSGVSAQTYSEVQSVRIEMAGLRAAVERLVDDLESGSGSPETAAILAGVQNKLDALEGRLNTSLEALGVGARDAVADLGEGGATQVRGSQD